MKDVTQDYIDNEEATERKPVEIYHIWRDGGEHWRYTDGDVEVTFDSEDYVPATLSRTLVQQDMQLDVTKMTVTAPYINDAIVDFISSNPIEILWITVMKLHREQSPYEADVSFVGQIKAVSFKGIEAQIECVGFEHFLNKTIPRWRYQINCNHQIFEDKCALVKASYLTTTVITLDATKTILTSTDFGLEDDGYFTRGEIVFGEESRTAVAHVGNNVTIMYKFITLANSDSIDIYPGCDGRITTCYDKYNNIVNFLGFPYIPVENPATRVVRSVQEVSSVSGGK